MTAEHDASMPHHSDGRSGGLEARTAFVMIHRDLAGGDVDVEKFATALVLNLQWLRFPYLVARSHRGPLSSPVSGAVSASSTASRRSASSWAWPRLTRYPACHSG